MAASDDTAIDLKQTSKLIQQLAQNRFYASSWLGGLSFAALAALASAPPSSSILTRGELPWVNGAVALFLGLSTLLFLISAYGAYVTIRLATRTEFDRLAKKITAEELSKLQSRDDAVKSALTKVNETIASEGFDVEVTELMSAREIHRSANGFISWGIVGLGMALLLVALEVNAVVLIVAVVVLAVLLVKVRALVSNELDDLGRFFRKPQNAGNVDKGQQ